MAEAILSAAAAAFIYLYAMAYQYGYQEPFGFLYLSLGPEKIVETVRPVLLYFVSASVIAVFLGSVARGLLAGRVAVRMITSGFLVAPVIIWLAPLLFVRVDISQVGDLAFLTVLYYLVDRLLLEIIFRRLATEPTYRYVQIAVAGLMLIVIAYDQGKFDALHMAEADLCPPIAKDNQDRIVAQKTSDTFVCVAIDRSTATVFRDVAYFKLPDDGAPKTFKTIAFHPTTFGAER